MNTFSPTIASPECLGGNDDAKQTADRVHTHPADAGGGKGGGGSPYYRRVSLNIYQRRKRFYVYLFRLGVRHFVGSFDSIAEARDERDKATKASPAKRPWSVKNVGRVIKTRKDYYLEHKAKGICTSCTDKAVPGRCLCEGCAYVQKMKREARKATK